MQHDLAARLGWLRRPDFWPQWHRGLRRLKPDLLLIAEAGAREPYWFACGFDAAYDWTDELGHWSMEHVFTDPSQIAPRLHAALTNCGRGHPREALAFRFLNNNDTGPRIITRYGLGLERVAAAMLLTLPGLPCIYTGQEASAEFEPYQTLTPIAWEDGHGLFDYYRGLIALRKSTPALHSRQWEVLEVASPEGASPSALGQVYAYARYGEGDVCPVLVVLNFSADRAQIALGLTRRSRAPGEGARLLDLLSGEAVPFARDGDVIRLRLPGLTARLLVSP